MAAYDVLIKFNSKPKFNQILQLFEQSVGDKVQTKKISIKINKDTGLLYDFEGSSVDGIEIGYSSLDTVKIWEYKEGYSIDFVQYSLKRHYLSGKAFYVLDQLGGEINSNTLKKYSIKEQWAKIKFTFLYY